MTECDEIEALVVTTHDKRAEPPNTSRKRLEWGISEKRGDMVPWETRSGQHSGTEPSEYPIPR
jgi:hypothetical protein